MIATRAYDEIADFLAKIDPRQIIEFRPSEQAQLRVEDLLYRERNSNLSTEERSELDHYITIEHLMRLAKAKAHKILKV
ncbi:MAG: hypothetical protein AAF847_10335 [Bacteroidota bacterium]